MRAIREGDAPSEPARIVKRKSYSYCTGVSRDRKNRRQRVR